MNLSDLKEMEKKYGFTYPRLYYKLLESGMLNWGLTQSDWFNTEFPKLKKKPPLLLFGDDFEILFSRVEIEEEIGAFSDEDDFRQTKKEYHNKFIPFGKTAGGDLYCFFLDDKNSIESIVLVWHDANEVDVLSKNLEDFIFRQLLECVIEPYEDGLIMSGDFKENITNQLSTHREFLNNKQIDVLLEVYKREMNDGLLTGDEATKILSEMGVISSSFEYQEE